MSGELSIGDRMRSDFGGQAPDSRTPREDSDAAGGRLQENDSANQYHIHVLRKF
jgi:hypothetical protein